MDEMVADVPLVRAMVAALDFYGSGMSELVVTTTARMIAALAEAEIAARTGDRNSEAPSTNDSTTILSRRQPR
ncbi:hypothetical protein AB0I35_24085 [Nocardia sp. NPDC050378]|uniref:hypothetical protein n=1 Tax=Nocardia sp. NPDC050378 TaxID=3155400 RepID=UPI0034035A69